VAGEEGCDQYVAGGGVFGGVAGEEESGEWVSRRLKVESGKLKVEGSKV
jgi:hypothetical protein